MSVPTRDENQNQVPQLLGTFITCLVIAYVGIILRLVARKLNGTPLKADDWLIVGSLVCFEEVCALSTADSLEAFYNSIYSP